MPLFNLDNLPYVGHLPCIQISVQFISVSSLFYANNVVSDDDVKKKGMKEKGLQCIQYSLGAKYYIKYFIYTHSFSPFN